MQTEQNIVMINGALYNVGGNARTQLSNNIMKTWNPTYQQHNAN